MSKIEFSGVLIPNLRTIVTATRDGAGACSFVEHKGIRYELLQSIRPTGWKWVVHIKPTKTRTGFSSSKQIAEFAARRAIDKAIKDKEAK